MAGGVRKAHASALALLAGVALGCSADGAHGAAANRSDAGAVEDSGARMPRAAAARVNERTVSVELLPFAEREISEGPDGELVWGALKDLEGVEVCLWKRRRMLERLEDFVDLEGPCHVSAADGKVPPFTGLTANSELVFRVTKTGFEPMALPFVTFEDDFVPPTVLAGARTALLRVGAADPWRETAPPGERDGLIAVWAVMHGLGTGAPGVRQLGVEPFPVGATIADGVELSFSPEIDGATLKVTTRSDRPRWLALEQGEYRVAFRHPRASCFWFASHVLLPNSGYPTEASEVMRMPVFAGHRVTIVADCLCDAQHTLGMPTDLASCSFAADAGG